MAERQKQQQQQLQLQQQPQQQLQLQLQIPFGDDNKKSSCNCDGKHKGRGSWVAAFSHLCFSGCAEGATGSSRVKVMPVVQGVVLQPIRAVD